MNLRLAERRSFSRLWLAQSISELGSWLGAIPLVAILVLDASPAQMGLLESARALASVLLGLYAGVWVDRLRRKRLLIAADVGRFVLLMLAVGLALVGVLGMAGLYAIAFCVGALTVLFDIAYRSYLPSLVKGDELVKANARLSTTASAAEVASPGIGGALAQMISATFALFVDALTFLASALVLSRIDGDEAQRSEESDARILQDILSGAGFVWDTPALRSLAIALSAQFFFGGFFAALYGLFVLRSIGAGPFVLGVLVGAGGVGALVGAAVVERVTARLGLGRTLIVSLVFADLLAVLVPLAALFEQPGAVALLLVAQLVGDIGFAAFLIVQTSLRQSLTPEHLLGRVNASFEFCVGGIGLVGILCGGLLGQFVGIAQALAVAVGGFVLPCIWLARSPIRLLQSTD